MPGSGSELGDLWGGELEGWGVSVMVLGYLGCGGKFSGRDSGAVLGWVVWCRQCVSL